MTGRMEALIHFPPSESGIHYHKVSELTEKSSQKIIDRCREFA